ncbi:hypothetical protein T484DRAFT_1784670, partial [Baffinella frigidus]
MALIEEAGEAQGHAHAHTHGDKPCSGHDNAAEKAKPAEKEPEMPDLFKTARQLVVLPVLYFSNKMDWENESNTFPASGVMLPVLYFSNKMDWKNEFNSLALQVAFSVVAVALFAIIQNEFNSIVLQVAFSVVAVALFAIIQVAFSVIAVALSAIVHAKSLTLIKIAAKKDERRVQNPGFKFKNPGFKFKIAAKKDERRVQNRGFKFEDKLAEDGTVSYQEYDSARTQEVRLQLLMSAVIGAGVRLQLLMSAVIGAGVYLKWEMAHPLIAMCVMQVIGAGVFLKWEMTHSPIAMCVMQPLSVYDLPAVHIHLLGKTGP